MYYKYDLYGRFDGTTEDSSERATDIAPEVLSSDYNWNGVNWVYAPNVATEPSHSIPKETTEQPVQESFKITRLAFRNRFTMQEKVVIEMAQLDDPSATLEQRSMSAALRASQADVTASTYIDLKREDTRNGVLQLEQMGILSEGRALEILDTPISELEKFKE